MSFKIACGKEDAARFLDVAFKKLKSFYGAELYGKRENGGSREEKKEKKEENE